MRAITLTVAGLLLATAGARAADDKNPNSFRWTDSKGVTHYGDHVPPEYAQSQTSELNKLGVELKRTEAQLTGDAAMTAEQRAAAAAREHQRDQVLLSTYLSVKDIEQLRDERLGLIEGQIVAARGFLTSAENRKKGLVQRAMNFRPYAAGEAVRRMPDPLAEELVRTVNEERSQRSIVVKKQAEKDDLRARFQADIDRYQTLVAQRAAAAARR